MILRGTPNPEEGHAMIDLYCERTAAGLLAEPVNAATNLAFLIAAWATGRLIRRAVPCPGALWTFPALMVCVGLGSGMFHTLATPWARVLDVLPIVVFQVAYVWLYARRLLSLGKPGSAAIVSTFLVAALLGRRFPAVLNGSLSYAPAALVILGLGAAHRAAGRREPLGLLAAGALFFLAVGVRSVDQALCEAWPLGTHFLWHLLAALAMYLASRAVVLNWPRPGRCPPESSSSIGLAGLQLVSVTKSTKSMGLGSESPGPSGHAALSGRRLHLRPLGANSRIRSPAG
jgi:hypothetical protein